MQNITEPIETVSSSQLDLILGKLGDIIAENLNKLREEIKDDLRTEFDSLWTKKKAKKRQIKTEVRNSPVTDSEFGLNNEEENEDEESSDDESDNENDKSSALIYYEQETERKRKWGDSKLNDFTSNLENEAQFLSIFAGKCQPLFAFL